MIKQHISGFFAPLLVVLGCAPCAALTAEPVMVETVHYADLADRALPAEIVAKVRILEVADVKPSALSAPPAGRSRVYAEAEIETLFKGPQDLSRQVSFLIDLPVDGRGHTPKIKKSEQIIFAQSVPQRSGFVQLIGPDAMLDWTGNRESLVHAILISQAAPDSPPQVIGIDNAFSVAGTVAGERETQIFLSTDSRPVSLTVAHHPGEAVRWSVALGEIADSGTPPPPRDTLLWYELACRLPAHFPAAKLAGQTVEAAEAIRADYEVIMLGLGPCVRGR
jgi:hypothetical protein